MKTRRIAFASFFLITALPWQGSGANATLLSWNNLGMHCMDSDYSVFSILPPYNTIEAQLIVGGHLVIASNGYAVTYEAVRDTSGSINTTSKNKSNFPEFSAPLYGAALAPDVGLAGWNMPGPDNTPQSMRFENTNSGARVNWFRAEGIPITAYDDGGAKNPYPMMRLIARDAGNAGLGTNDIVLPVSDEMDCRRCHGSGTMGRAQPPEGWAWVANADKDYRLNILRLHDSRRDPSSYQALLAKVGLNPQGLYRSVVVDGTPVLCAKCHLSEALPGTGQPGVPPLTAAVHTRHASVVDPDLGIRLDDSTHRAACYRCHPGAVTRCLRGAMGAAVAADGSLAIQCQNCHGNMSQVGSPSRTGWLDEPNCGSCHTGTATSNAGQIRFTSAFTDPVAGVYRQPVNRTFSSQPDTPAPGFSLYRFSSGHGGLQCAACHGSTHAEFPSSHASDNVRNGALQGHAGVMVECTACHTSTPNSGNGGPHGMHVIAQGWLTGEGGVTKHADRISALGGLSACATCHGSDFRGTVLSQAQASRSFTMNFDAGSFTLKLNRGDAVGCYNCHNGPSSDSLNSAPAPTVSNADAATTNDKAVAIPLTASSGASTLRILRQPANGTVGLSNGVALYTPLPGFVGTDAFAFGAYNGARNSSPGTGTVIVAQGPYSVKVDSRVPSSGPAQLPLSFGAAGSAQNAQNPLSYTWRFSDGGTAQGQYVYHTFTQPGDYQWEVVAALTGASDTGRATNSGTIYIGAPLELSVVASGGAMVLTWPTFPGDALLETATALSGGPAWNVVTNLPSYAPATVSVSVPASDRAAYFRLRKL